MPQQKGQIASKSSHRIQERLSATTDDTIWKSWHSVEIIAIEPFLSIAQQLGRVYHRSPEKLAISVTKTLTSRPRTEKIIHLQVMRDTREILLINQEWKKTLLAFHQKPQVSRQSAAQSFRIFLNALTSHMPLSGEQAEQSSPMRVQRGSEWRAHVLPQQAVH